MLSAVPGAGTTDHGTEVQAALDMYVDLDPIKGEGEGEH
jgi:hypothetical protein